MKPIPKELVDLYDERVALKVRISLQRENGSDPAAIDETREQLTSVSYRIQRLERDRMTASSVGRALRVRQKPALATG